MSKPSSQRRSSLVSDDRIAEAPERSRVEAIIGQALNDRRFRERLLTDLGAVVGECGLTRDEVVAIAVGLAQRLDDADAVDARAERAALFRIVAAPPTSGERD